MKMVEISEKQLESYIRAEEFCREYRFYISDARNETKENHNKLISLFMKWFRNCKKIKFERP